VTRSASPGGSEQELFALGEAVAREEDAWLEAQPLDAARLAVSLPARERRSRFVRPLALCAALSLAAVAALVFVLGRDRLEARVDGQAIGAGAWIAPSAQGVPLDFSDGSRLLFAPGTRARLNDLTSNGAHVVVEAGGVQASVVHRSGTNYRLSFGPFAVDVTGTKFDVNWDPTGELLTLELREGSVVVSGCLLGSGRPVMAGETLRAWCKDRRFEVSALGQSEKARAALVAAPEAPAPTLPSAVPRGEIGRSPAGAAPAPAGPDWQALARAGRYQEALAAIGIENFAAECERASVVDLGLLADVARFSNRPQKAIQAYTALRRRFPGGARSAQAGFAMARLHFDQLGQYDEAARWFRTYLGEQPRGPFAREALGRLMEAEQRSGQLAQAKETAQRYLDRYPNGPHARLAERLVSR
jgi:transmembrane sensor